MNAALSIENFTANFTGKNIATTAVKNISFSVNEGEIIAIAGESGSGKSVTALSVLNLLSKNKIQYAGKILFKDIAGEYDLLQLTLQQLQQLRGNKIGMIFQEPMTSLNPLFTCGMQVREAIMAHKKISRKAARILVFAIV